MSFSKLQRIFSNFGNELICEILFIVLELSNEHTKLVCRLVIVLLGIFSLPLERNIVVILLTNFCGHSNAERIQS